MNVEGFDRGCSAMASIGSTLEEAEQGVFRNVFIVTVIGMAQVLKGNDEKVDRAYKRYKGNRTYDNLHRLRKSFNKEEEKRLLSGGIPITADLEDW